ncbi:AAA family ATPase [Actinomadura barringtoniae]|uniref:AAA family ATPase n=1 Tax=Actinomadura barringtoniae TaxID=1427535 RepID=A0A939PKV9_9ACTN|nr:AAA family ATPase [Actinomadura barringtoniae]MBO2451024.1 AAA family ATPase [Actinomadura barringtoniae]
MSSPNASHRPARLVGRRDVLDLLDRALNATRTGGFLQLSLIGEPGVGKTRLLRELATRAAPDLAVFEGRATEFEQETPFGLILDALEDHVERADLALTTDEKCLLAHLFPTLSEGSGLTGDLSGLARHHLHRATRRLLELIAEERGLVLILDDLHWADTPSLDLLDYLVRHPPRARILVAMGYRPQQASAQLVTLSEEEGGRAIPVRPFTEGEADEFLTPRISRSRRRELFQESGGNPFYLEALTQMDPGGTAAKQAVDAEFSPELPLAVRAALQAEFANLDPAVRTVAQGAAVISDEFNATLTAAASGMSESMALSGLDTLVARDIVRPAAPAHFRFRHPLLRQAAYESAGAGWRLAAHARLAAHLERLGAPAVVRARHVEHSAQFGDGAAIATLTEAARAVAAHAPTTTAHWLRAALDLMPEDAGHPGLPDRVDLLFELFHVQAVSGRADMARGTGTELLRILPAEDYARRAKAVQLCGVIYRQLGRHELARAFVRDELAKIADPESPAAAILHARTAADRLLVLDIDGAQAALDHIPERAPEWPPGLEVAVEAMRALPAYGHGRVADALRYLDETGSLIDGTPDEHLHQFMDSLGWFCWSTVLLGRYELALHHFEQTRALALRTGQNYMLGYILAGLARLHVLTGRLPEAAKAADEALEEGRLLRSDELRVYAITQQCLCASEFGEHDRALRLGEEAMAVDPHAREWWSAMARYTHAAALLEAERMEEGTAAMLDLWNAGPAEHLDPGTLVSSAERMSHAEATAGRAEDAHRWAGLAESMASPELAGEVGLARLARAHALRLNDPGAAAALAAEAAELLGAAGRRPDSGKAELAAAKAHGEAGERTLAKARLRNARQIFEDCSMRGLNAKVVREQRRLGVYVPTSAGGRTGNDHGLSRRELDVVALIIEGDSNQQIAERLFISVRTVETHISHIFAKLGVSSRLGVARAMADRSAT